MTFESRFDSNMLLHIDKYNTARTHSVFHHFPTILCEKDIISLEKHRTNNCSTNTAICYKRYTSLFPTLLVARGKKNNPAVTFARYYDTILNFRNLLCSSKYIVSCVTPLFKCCMNI